MIDAFDAVIAGVTLAALLFASFWLRRPDLRVAIEAPKHRMLRQEERYGRASNG